jgi:hypothetical protein
MPTQVITIGPAGELSGLQVKPGKGLDLRQFGKARIERASEIEWNDDHQAWTVRITKGLFKDRFITHDLCEEIGFQCNRADLFYYCGPPEDHLIMAEYDEAVRVEIAVLDHIRVTLGPHYL